MLDSLNSLQKYLHYHALIIWRTKAFWLRALLCFAIGTVVLTYDEVNNFDLRLKIRGPKPTASNVVLIDVSERDWAALDPDSRNILRPLKEIVTLSDSFFWNPRTWDKLLTSVLGDEPAAVGVTFFFGENIRPQQVSVFERASFADPRIVWGADIDASGRVLVPVFASNFNGNIGLRGLRSDDDGSVRRFSSTAVSSSLQIPHLGTRLAAIARPDLSAWIARSYKSPTLINYSGGVLDSSFPVYSAKDVVEGRLLPQTFEGKIVVIGSLGSPADQMQTPLGRMSRAEIIANIAENALMKKSVTRLSSWFYLLIMAALLAASIVILIHYPQSVALVTFVLGAAAWASASAFSFDILKIWLPVLAPLVQLTATCLVFLSYQLALNERRTWRLEQEQRYLSEIEQLKTNFVSMMSHDLKTPIAKIQAICDRLLATSLDGGFAQDLKSLRRSSDELHRYIQSILQVTKVEAKDFQIRKEVTDINEDIERVMQRLQPLAQEKNLLLRTELEPMFSIEADTTLIQEVIHNLVENAIKYTPSGGRVTVISKEKDDNVHVLVEDTGPGIDPEDQKDIWGKFTRGRNPSMEIKGTGLGLYLVKYFIELHGGRVFLESTPGQGTKIGFSIPVSDQSDFNAQESGS
jgi:two-component system, OmpR family, phosphate regulon sensor histidine kinase PhoR